jgi:excisionase family DNA binding protein
MVEYMTVEQAASELAISARGIRARVTRGEMRAERLGARLWAIPRDEVERWRTLGRQKPGPKQRKRSDER